MTPNAEARTKALLSVFLSFLGFALRPYIKLTYTHIHGALHIYFALTSFCVNLRCQRGLNMAVITGYYESHVSVALLPNLNEWRHRNFHDNHKKTIPRGEKRNECVHMCTAVCMQRRIIVQSFTYANAVCCRESITWAAWCLCAPGFLLCE